MKPLNLLALLLVTLLLFIGVVATPYLSQVLSTDPSRSVSKVQAQVKASTHVIYFSTFTKESSCSGTAISRHAVLTAAHCEEPSDFVSIDGVPGYRVDEIIRDANDHSILLIRGIEFKDFIPLGSVRELRESEPVFIWGNPSYQGVVYTKQLRQGKYRASHVHKGRLVDVLDFHGFPGDSGSGVFTSTGELLGVVSFVGNMPIPPTGDIGHATGAVRLAFTSADKQRVVNFK